MTIIGIMVISLIFNILLSPQEVAMSATTVQTADSSAVSVATTTTANMYVQIFDMLVFLCLLFIPSNTFGAKKQD